MNGPRSHSETKGPRGHTHTPAEASMQTGSWPDGVSPARWSSIRRLCSQLTHDDLPVGTPQAHPRSRRPGRPPREPRPRPSQTPSAATEWPITLRAQGHLVRTAIVRLSPRGDGSWDQRMAHRHCGPVKSVAPGFDCHGVGLHRPDDSRIALWGVVQEQYWLTAGSATVGSDRRFIPMSCMRGVPRRPIPTIWAPTRWCARSPQMIPPTWSWGGGGRRVSSG